jgi:hypothetical protein
MSNTINWGKIYEKTAWGIGVINNISWGKIYANLAGSIPSFALDFTNIANDFTFTRSSFATRVNEFGLIETVTDLGSDLVQNGDFEELGSELVTNGDFSNGANGWNNNASFPVDYFSVVDNKLEIENISGGTQVFTSDSFNVSANKIYKISLDTVKESGIDDFDITLRNSPLSTVIETITSTHQTGELIHYFKSASTQSLIFQFTLRDTIKGSIDNVSVKQVDPNNDWVKGTGWSIEDGKGTYDDVAYGGILTQLSVFTIGKKYRVSLDLESGSVRVKAGTASYTNYTSPFDVVADDNTTLSIQTTSATATIDNIVIKEVLEDDIPRIDYTGSTFDVPVLGNELIDYSNITYGSGGWSLVNGKWFFDDITAGFISTDDFDVVVGEQYEVTVDVTISSGNANFRVSSGNAQTILFEYTDFPNGITKFVTTVTGVDGFIQRLYAPTSLTDNPFTLNSISIKKITAYTTTDKGSFLLEPQSTNLIPYSEDFSDSSWLKVGSPTITPNYGTSPDGTQNSTRIQGNSSSVLQTNAMTGATSGETRSLYVRAVSGSGNIQLTSHNSNTNNVFAIDENWQRVQTNSLTSTTGSTYFYIDMRGASTNIYDIEVWGCQGEALPYATSYIPTNGTAVTRSAESCVDGVVSANSLEGVLYWEGSSDVDSTVIIAELSQGNITNRLSLYYQFGSDARGSIRVSDVQTTLTGGGTLSTNKKIAVVWGNNVISFWVNGSQVDTDTYVGSIPEGVLTALNFAQAGGGSSFYGRTKDLKIYDKALSDSELEELTTI